MDALRGYARVNGTRLYYESVGDGHPLVLIHGFTFDTRMWDSQVLPFSQRYRVIRYDMRGFGRSTPPTMEPYAHAKDLKALLDHLGIESAYVLGLSRGGRIAIDFASAYPNAVDALIPVDACPPGFPRLYEDDAVGPALRTELTRKGAEAARALWLTDYIFEPATEKPESIRQIKRVVSDYSCWHWANDDPVFHLVPAAAQQIHEITAPTLIVVGERDLPDFVRAAHFMEKKIPDSRLFVVPDVGHMSNLEAPDLFNEIVLSFLAELDTRTL